MKQLTKLSNIDQFLPRWTKRVIAETGGRDPLGLSRVSDMIVEFLLTGITTQTNRARYYSFYCWNIWNIWHIHLTEKPQKYKDFVDSFRRREAVLAMSTYANNSNTSPVGIKAARPILEKGFQRGEMDSNFRVLPSNALGGYGQYYGGSLYQLGLTRRIENGIDHLNKGMGEALAEAFHLSIHETPYIQKELFRKTKIPLVDFDGSKKLLTLDAIMKKSGVIERKLLIDLFFGFNGTTICESTLLRRHTLGQILHILCEYERHDLYLNLDSIDVIFVYAPSYFDVIWSEEDDKTIPYKCPEKFRRCHSLWRQFCLQQYFTNALENILFAVLEIIGNESAGLTIENIVLRLMETTFLKVLREKAGKDCYRPREILKAFNIEDIPTHEASYDLQQLLIPTAKNSEFDILRISEEDTGSVTAKAMLLLAVLYGKWRGIQDEEGMCYVHEHAGNGLWFWTFMPIIDKWLDKNTKWDETLERIIRCFIVDQHDRIMYEKKRLESCWFRTDGNRLFKEQEYSPKFRANRHLQAVNIMRDLCLIESDDEGYLSITSKGKTILNKILNEHE
ncbi:MAG: hypothetical protein M5U24_02980 [Candidatus Kuenenia sp.]|nr:hypothetical protein [Candidatus Kuenenia sp.]MCZ7621438.1 hypothetical protein [Candidatus Kuenenia sp.]